MLPQETSPNGSQNVLDKTPEPSKTDSLSSQNNSSEANSSGEEENSNGFDADTSSGDDSNQVSNDEELPADQTEDAISTSALLTTGSASSSTVQISAATSQQSGWVQELGSTYYYSNGVKHTGWLVVNKTPAGQVSGLQRYWLDANGVLQTGLIDAGNSWWAFGIADAGYVVRGKYYDPATGYWYLADNDGKLLAPGWHVTGSYDNGRTQRYYIDATAHAAIPGVSNDGWAHYVRKDVGYVLRGTATFDGSTYYANNDGKLYKDTWVVSSSFGQGMQRYWFGNDGKMAKSRLVDPAEGSGYWAYALSDGRILRATYDTGRGRVYLADNDGRLATNEGWLVTGLYTGGKLQRYSIDSAAHAARTSFFTINGQNYFGLGGVGYVFRGTGYVGGEYCIANNDGKLAKNRWLVTNALGNGTQRYWIGANSRIAKSRLVDPAEGSGYWAYALSDGRILRATYDTGRGRVYLADNDGRLATNEGWLVTGLYTGGKLQRYSIDSVAHAARSGFFEVSGEHYFGQGNVGYVLRGKQRYGSGMLLADNDGKLAWKEGWLVTGIYDGGKLQRYRIDSSCNGYMGAHLGLFKIDGNSYYGTYDRGYVARNVPVSVNGTWYKADNDGVLREWVISGNKVLDGYLLSVINQCGTDLRSLFDYVARYPYVSGSLYPSGNWSIPFAIEMYQNHGGNCYRYAALFCWLAKAVGYDAQAISGSVPSHSQGWAAHGWVEVYINGVTYICDPDMVAAYPQVNWYMNTYSNAPIAYRK